MAKVGRPTDYSEELATLICERLVKGESLNKICQDDDIPEIGTIFRWLSEKQDFNDKYVRAKQEQSDTFQEKIHEVADEVLKGKYDPNAARVAIDAYKWTASKLKPKKYGDKVDVTSGGEKIKGNTIIFSEQTE